MKPILPTIALLALATGAGAQPENSKRLTFPKYEALVTPQGNVWSLKVGGQEFLKASVDISRGSYFYQSGVVESPVVEQPDANTFVTKGPKASARYEFTADGAKWTVTNATAQPMQFFFVLDPAVSVARNEDGTWARGPLAGLWKKSTWFRGAAKLEVNGTTRIWGPWRDTHQILETALAANETRVVELKPGVADAAEGAKVAQLAAQPAPTAVTSQPAPPPVVESDLTVLAPRNYQVVQRKTRARGTVLFSGRVKPACDAVELRLGGRNLDAALTNWLKLPFSPPTRSFFAATSLPAGGWYKAELRALKNGAPVATAEVANFGVGEVFVGAGQSNSTNSGGEGKLKPQSGLVSTFSGNDWRLADDPQPGTHDKSSGGSFWPAFGDAMAQKYGVPIGVAVTGHGGTSTNAWQPGSELFNWTMTRVHQLGPQGFRALLWHQGESDVGMSSDEHERKLTNIIRGTQAAAGWDFPWIVAQVSYHNPDKPRFDSTRNAQKVIWDKGIALEGPDTDTLTGDHRDGGGRGIHFSPKGLTAHGQMWAEKTGVYLDKVLAE